MNKNTIFYTKSLYILGITTILLLIVFLTIIKPRLLFFTQPDIVGNLNEYNLILVNIDALRADHLGCYGYHRNTSPFIDSVAENGVTFEQAMSNSSYTRESVAVLLSGRLPTSGNAIGWKATPSKRVKSIGELFQEAGYKTAFLSNTSVLRNPNFTKGVQEVYHLRKWGVSGNGPDLSSRAGAFMKRCDGEKFLLYLHYLDPHGPYEPPEAFHRRFTQDIYPHPLSLYGEVRATITSLAREGFGPGDPFAESAQPGALCRHGGRVGSADRTPGRVRSRDDQRGGPEREEPARVPSELSQAAAGGNPVFPDTQAVQASRRPRRRRLRVRAGGRTSGKAHS